MAGTNDFTPLPTGVDLATLQAAMQANAEQSSEYSGGTITLSPGDLTPGSGGSLTDSFGNVFTLPFENDGTTTNNVFGDVYMNGQEFSVNGRYTDALSEKNGVIYAEDGKGGHWYSVDVGSMSFIPASDPGSPDVPTGVNGGGTPAGSPTSSGPTPSSSTGGGSADGTFITPGSGTFTDSAGNVYSVDAAGNADENGAPIPGGSGTSAMDWSQGAVYGQDANSGSWYTWNQSGWYSSGAPPTGTGGSVAGGSTAGGPTPSGSTGGSTSGGDTALVTSGSGSFVASNPDGVVGTWSIDPNGDVADFNGQSITINTSADYSSGTGALEISGGQVYGQDENSGQWYQIASKGTAGEFEWQVASPPPSSPALSASSEVFDLTAGQAFQAVLSDSISTMSFVGMGSLDVTGSTGPVDYQYHDTSGVLTIENFSMSKGDILTVDKALQPAMIAQDDHSGGTMLSFGQGQEIDLKNVTAAPNVQWA